MNNNAHATSDNTDAIAESFCDWTISSSSSTASPVSPTLTPGTSASVWSINCRTRFTPAADCACSIVRVFTR